MIIRSATVDDAAQIAAIYNHYVVNTTITFEEEEVSVSEMQSRIEAKLGKYPWLVLEEDGLVIGYSYAGEWRARAAYRNTCETAIYLRYDCAGKGRGSALYKALMDELRKTTMRCVIGGIALPNAESEKLHLKCGFERIGNFPEVGNKFNKWIDVVFYQKMLVS